MEVSPLFADVLMVFVYGMAAGVVVLLLGFIIGYRIKRR